MRLTIFLCLIIFVILAGCAPAANDEPMAGAAGQNAQTPAAEVDEPYTQDVELMAADLGISVEEALRRLENEDAIAELQARLTADEGATFAGLWVEHEPQYRVVVAFSGDAQEILGRYVDRDHSLAGVVEARNVTYAYEQLQADQQAAGRLLQELALSAASAINVQENLVEIYLSDRAAFDEALASAGADLPPSVTLVTVYEPLGESPPITPAPDVFMPQLKQRDVAFMEALLTGELVVDQGCLRVEGENESHLVIWQADYFLTDNHGALEILDETGEVAARIGETVYMGGGEQPGVDDAELLRPLPEQCGGPYWRMGEFLPQEYIAQETAVTSTASHDQEAWQDYALLDAGLIFSYPGDLYVHQAPKSVQISSARQPTWSSFADPQPDSRGLLFDLLYNLNRQMGATPQQEIDNMRGSFEEELEVITSPAPWPAGSNVFVGAYRFVNEKEGMALLIGAAPNPNRNSPQPTISLISVVKEQELDAVYPIFAGILSSVRPAVERSSP